ncbi:endothelial differentiation-related factor 1 [Anaeramoeba ignava]|uniref:Endothelial differentiation-related factor 1 n=1 Tax=Anaeramoeba ignava TaxID=1746090 RepID=A0A9Q0L5F1_ANAIG|nr:endothelial differentiation-related factor 1 [Anaeramoeba ignava]
MDYQDWNPVFIGNKKPEKKPEPTKKEKEKTKEKELKRAIKSGNVIIEKKRDAGKNAAKKQDVNMKNVEEAETFETKNVGLKLGKKIQQARATKKWTQKELGMRISEKQSVVNEYETGKAVKNNQILAKMEKALGVKLRGKI